MKVIPAEGAGLEPQAPPRAAGRNAPNGVFQQLRSLLGALRRSRHRSRVLWLTVGLVVVVAANMVGQVRLNAWQGDFYDALEQQNMGAFVEQIGIFLIIVAVLLTLVVAETWLREIIEVRLREWLTHDLLDEWLVAKRAYLLAFAGEIGENPDQRMQADCQRLTEFSSDLGLGLLRSTLLLVSFIGVLWLLSTQVQFAWGEASFTIPGYLVWCALAYAISGSWLTWRVGRPLIAINAERYAREAELRFALVRINEAAEGISLYGGEPDERRALSRPVERVVDVTRLLANGLARLTWITAGYGWLALVVPIMVAAPGYFQGSLSFGELMMVVGAFNHVQTALRWFVDNFPRIADWRATLLRVVTFRDALQELETMGRDASRIERTEHPDGNVVMEGLQVLLPDGRAVLEDDGRVEVSQGEHLLIVGEHGGGKSTLFRALAGLWPWGSGRISLPVRGEIMFIPQRPYLPVGTLGGVVAYPDQAERFTEQEMTDALGRVDLGHLVPQLGKEQRWDRQLSLDQQQRVVFARLLLHQPRYVVLDNVTANLTGEHRRLMFDLFEHELASATVISISQMGPADSFFSRMIKLQHVASDERLDLELHPPETEPRPAAG
jgi:putative ATP-binding cassette transporter